MYTFARHVASCLVMLVGSILLFPFHANAAPPTQAPIVKVYDQKAGQVLIYWTSIPNAATYRLEVQRGSTTSTIITGTTKTTVTGLTPGQPATFTVNAQNTDGQGPTGSTTFTQASTPPTDNVTGFQFTTTKNGRVVLRWLPTANATLHRVLIQDQTIGNTGRLWITGSTSLVIGNLDPTAPDATPASVINLTHTYRARIKAVNAAGAGPEGEFLSRLDYAATPGVPIPAVITPTSPISAFLSWAPIQNATFTDVYVGDNAATLFSQRPLQITGTTTTVTGLLPDRPYLVVIRGHNNRGQGGPSPVRQFRTVSLPAIPSLSVNPGATTILTWNPDPNVTRYVLQYTIGANTTLVDPATSPTTLTTLPAGTTITARVKAINLAGETLSNQVQWTTPPPAPSIFQTIPGAGSVTLHWTPVTGATSYVVYTNPGLIPAHGQNTTTTETTATIIDLAHGTYTFVVTAKTGTSESADSDPATATVAIVGVSRLYNGAFGNGASTLLEGASLSPTGRFAMFFTNALNLSDLNTGNSLMIYDQQLGTLDFVASNGTTAGRGRHATTPDGHAIAFTSNDGMIVFDDTNNAPDVFLTDISTGELLRVSVDEAGQQIPGTSNSPFISDDGNEILFLTSGLGGGSKPYLHHRLLGYSEAALITLSGQDGIGEPCGFSANGQVVAVLSTTTSATDLDPDTRFRSRKQLYVRDLQAGITRGESASSDIDREHFINGTPATDHVTACALSGDAAFVAFESAANNLVATDTNVKKDIFLRNLMTGTTERVSLTTADGQLADDSFLVNIVTPPDGGIAVIFKTKAPVRTQDTAFATARYYAWYRNPAGTAIVFPLLDPAGTPPNKLSVSRDGAAMALETPQALNASDTNATTDIYLDSIIAP